MTVFLGSCPFFERNFVAIRNIFFNFSIFLSNFFVTFSIFFFGVKHKKGWILRFYFRSKPPLTTPPPTSNTKRREATPPKNVINQKECENLQPPKRTQKY